MVSLDDDLSQYVTCSGHICTNEASFRRVREVCSRFRLVRGTSGNRTVGGKRRASPAERTPRFG